MQHVRNYVAPMASLPQWPPEVSLWLLYTLIIVAERYLSGVGRSHPAHALNLLAIGMARKVQRPDNSRSQQRISGLMALLSLTLPWLVIVAMVMWISELDWIIDALILFVCLHSCSARKDFNAIAGHLKLGHNERAKALNQAYVSRDTSRLSELGNTKAGIEWYSRFITQAWVSTLLWFVVVGPLAALAYRIIYQLAQAWPATQTQWRDFGFAANWLARAFSWPGVYLVLLMLAMRQLLGGKVLPWRFAQQPYMHAQDGKIWRAVASRLHITLGGPIMLNGRKRVRPKFHFGAEPSPHALPKLGRLMTRIQLCTWLIISPLLLIGLVIQ
ncbi:cobalamin biosynthesis protein CobD/CbiB [Aliidiomarina maris]|uniref:Cobalamin biosynthesis protein CobD/CbiB n=2 Tax=Aliidiomarina maris TaxID=531312 RepID=A0A327X2J3_9GAMM|nr:cobalamin biosynthesis protein CobD/CbiB [Aliidiomarina maris]